MALWTPYADDTALDLTTTRLKEETEYTRLDEPRTPEVPYVVYPQPIYANPAHISPISANSYISYEAQQHDQMIYQSYPRTNLSPPISPEQYENMRKRSLSMVDSDYLSDDPDFQEFERVALRTMAEKNGGTLLGNNPRMRRTVQSKNETADETYRRQRERNNYAAKQSRDRRKLREIHLALKVNYLRKELSSLKAVLASRRCVKCQQLCSC
ncbi:transcription factor VBP [Bombyx mori]|uniref:BZIP domain-containing protein n=1 Tax=Bombyx mori TaxID=7091 RepID=A0A8R2C5Z4_BOMMO|nr:transcription factor VBP [Bombyx mori]